MTERQLYEIEWTHDDGMDEHRLYASLTPTEALTVRSTLEARGGINVDVAAIDARYAMGFASVMAEINDDLPEDES